MSILEISQGNALYGLNFAPEETIDFTGNEEIIPSIISDISGRFYTTVSSS